MTTPFLSTRPRSLAFIVALAAASVLTLAAVAHATAPAAAGSAKTTVAAGKPLDAAKFTPKSSLPFIVDDYPKALAAARAQHLPLFVEVWAPWCHSCRSMRAFVLTDPALAKDAKRYVWLELDSENAKNAAVTKQLHLVALPSVFILDPKDERVAVRWIGAASVNQVERLLDAGEGAVRGGGTGVDAVLARADSLFGANANAEAAAAYEDALHMAPTDWPQRAHAAESVLYTLAQVDSSERCAKLALEQLPAVRHGASAGNVAASGLDCALALPAAHAERATLIATLDRAGREIAADRTVPMSADDRSGLYIELLSARDDANDSVGHRTIALQWSAFLDGEAAKAKTPAERTVFDPHRLSAYLDLGQPERAIPMLQQSRKDFPDDYNPYARLAIAYNAMKHYDEALAASDGAFARVYGPRQFTLWRTRIDILLGKGDREGARSAAQSALAAAQAMPDGQRSEATIASFKKRVDELSQPATPVARQ